jgi:hypothetical protein
LIHRTVAGPGISVVAGCSPALSVVAWSACTFPRGARCAGDSLASAQTPTASAKTHSKSRHRWSLRSEVQCTPSRSGRQHVAQHLRRRQGHRCVSRNAIFKRALRSRCLLVCEIAQSFSEPAPQRLRFSSKTLARRQVEPTSSPPIARSRNHPRDSYR